MALAVEDALALPDGEGELLASDVEDLGVGVVDAGSETASRITADCPAGTVRAADVVAGG